MTTDPTPHTERAAAAARELRANYLINRDHPLLQAVPERELAAIIAKHFPDDAAKDAYHYRYALILAGCPEDDVDNPPDLINWARHNNQQHDALRLAAGRALEALKGIVDICDMALGLDVLRPIGTDGPRGKALAAITALSDALAGEQRRKDAP